MFVIVFYELIYFILTMHNVQLSNKLGKVFFMKLVALFLLCLFLSACQASGTHKGASVSASILSLEF